MPNTLLDTVRTRCVVDIDQLDPALAEKLGPFQDMTSNQALLNGVVSQASEEPFLRAVAARAKAEAESSRDAVELALDLFAVLIAKRVLPHIDGRVHAQLSPRYSGDVQDSVRHGRRLRDLFNKEKIPTDRICLKIPATGAGMTAARILEAEGIRTLATTLFSVDQAAAAAQAGCLYVAPYFNELSVHFEPETWVGYGDTAAEHPMCGVISGIVALYAKIPGPKPLVMPASIVTADEAVALTTLGVDHLTLSGAVLTSLATAPAAASPDLPTSQEATRQEHEVAAPSADESTGGDQLRVRTDFIKDGGNALDASIAADASVQRRLAYALKTFGSCEESMIKLIQQHL